jgi:hypothetical protein
MAATLNDIILMMRTERYKRERSRILARVAIKRSVVDLSLAEVCPPEATAIEVLLHCMRPLKKRS